MKQLKKFFIYNLIAAMIFSLCACGGKGKISDETKKDNKGGQQNQSQDQSDSQSNTQGDGASTVEDMIEKYHQSEGRNVKAYLLLGIDKGGEASEVDAAYGTGQNDGIYIIAVDNDNKKSSVLQINRDTYADIKVYDAFGKALSVEKNNLSMAYTYGFGAEDSCECAEAAISDFLHGLKFDGYVAIYYDAISPVVDTVGGVDITIKEDLTSISPEFVKGANVHMDGESSYKFCRARKGVGDGSNEGRMDRQRTFLSSFLGTCRAVIKQRSSVINDMYNASSPYIVSNLSSGELCNIAALALSYSDGGIVTPKGENEFVTENGKTYCNFIVDDNNLNSILKELFALEK